MDKKVRSSSSGSKISSRTEGIFFAIPAGITGLLRRFWPFAKKFTKKFSEECENPEEKEGEFMAAVKKDANRWT